MKHTLLLLLTAILLGVHSQTTDSQSPSAPPRGVESDDSPALVAADPALVSAIVQGVINEVGAVTQQSEEPVHVTPELVQNIVQKVLLKLSVTLTQLDPGFHAASANVPPLPSGPVNSPAAGPAKTNADTADPGNKTESDRPHPPRSLGEELGNALHRLHPHHGNDNGTNSTKADSNNPANKTDSKGMHLPHLHDIAETLGNLFHRHHHSDNDTNSTNADADNRSVRSANRTDTGGLRLPGRLRNLGSTLRNLFHRRGSNNDNDTDNTNADSANPANRTESSSGPHLPHLHNLADNLRNFFRRHGNNDSDNTSADSANPANKTDYSGLRLPRLHNLTHALDDFFHHHRNHHHHNDSNDNSNNKAANSTNSDKANSANRPASGEKNVPPLAPPNPRRLGDRNSNDNNNNNISINNAASVSRGNDSASNGSTGFTLEPRRPGYPPLRLGGVQNKPLSKEQICQLPQVSGLCRGYMPRYHYNATSGGCTRFIFGGCGGNQNNFKTEEECTSFCAP